MRLRFPRRWTMLCVGWLVSFVASVTFRAAGTNMDESQQRFVGYPPSVYLRSFLACSPDAPCTRTDDFRVDPVPEGCCTLLLTNGDGRGNDEVRSYEVLLNGDRVISVDNSRNSQATVKVLPSNTIKLVLTGEPHSRVFVLIAYDPRKSK